MKSLLTDAHVVTMDDAEAELYVGGELVVRGGALVRADEGEIARAHRMQARRIAP